MNPGLMTQSTEDAAAATATASAVGEGECPTTFDDESAFEEQTAPCLLGSAEVSARQFRLTVVAILTVLTIVGNSLAIFIIKSRPRQGASDKLWEVRMVTSLFCSDLLQGLSAMVMAFIGGIWSGAASWSAFSRTQLFFVNWCGFCSVYHLAAISLVKMLAIARPLHFEQEVTSRRCWAGVAAIWLFTFVVSLPIFLGFVRTHYSEALLIATIDKRSVVFPRIFGSLLYIPATSIIVTSYGKIFTVVVKHKMKISEIPAMPGVSNNHHKNVLAAVKSAKKMVAIIAVYFAAYTPLAVLLVTGHITGRETRGQWHTFIVVWVSFGNSCYNCILYIAMHKKNRAAFRQVWVCQKKGDKELSEL